jgi:hypothetical protein
VLKSTSVFVAETVTAIAFTLMVIEAWAAGSATEVAVTVTNRSPGEGGVEGAV